MQARRCFTIAPPTGLPARKLAVPIAEDPSWTVKGRAFHG